MVSGQAGHQVVPGVESLVGAGAALGHLQDNALYEPCGAGGAPAPASGAWAEALAVQGQHSAAIRHASWLATLIFPF